jgi:hypothetical protein
MIQALLSADRVATDVLSTRIATSVSKEPRNGLHRADVKPLRHRGWTHTTLPLERWQVGCARTLDPDEGE